MSKIHSSLLLGIYIQIEHLIEFYCENITDDELEQSEDLLQITISNEELSYLLKETHKLYIDSFLGSINFDITYDKNTGTVTSKYDVATDIIEFDNKRILDILDKLLMTAQNVLEMRDDDLSYRQNFPILEQFSNGEINGSF